MTDEFGGAMTDELRLTLNLPKPEYFDSFDNLRATL
jgi:hypothetical protein